MVLKLVIFGSGRGSNFEAIQQSIENRKLNAEIQAIVVDNPNAKMIEKARNKKLDVIIVDKNQFSNREEQEKEIIKKLEKYDYDLIALAGYMRILSSKFIEEIKHPIINIHPALLPSFPGLHAQRQALDAGVKISGCTVHIVDESVDGGKILGQKAVEIQDNDTEDSLSDRILVYEHILYSEILNKIEKGIIDLNK